MWANERVKELTEKWQVYVPAHNKRAGPVAMLLENQANVFRSSQLPDDLEETFGNNWKDKVYHAIAKAWSKCPLIDMVSIQPLSKPTDAIGFYSQSVASTPLGGIPTVNMNIQTVNVQATVRRLGLRVYPGNFALVDSVFDQVMLASIREVLGVMHGVAAAQGNTLESTHDEFDANISRASMMVHKHSMRGPANHVIGNAKMLKLFEPEDPADWDMADTGLVKKVGVFKKRMHVYLDPLFPDGEVMLWYMGPSMLDAPIIYSPFCYDLAPMDGRHNFALVLRHSLHMAHPSHVQIVKVNVLERLAQIN